MYTPFSVTFSFCDLICMLKSAPFLLIVFKLLELVLCTCYCLRRDLPNLVVFLPLNWHVLKLNKMDICNFSLVSFYCFCLASSLLSLFLTLLFSAAGLLCLQARESYSIELLLKYSYVHNMCTL